MKCPICKKDYHPQEGSECHKCADAKEKPLSPSDATACSPRDPLRRAYSRDELVAEMNQWMVEKFGSPMDYIKEPDQRDKWYRDNGFLHHFICEHFPAENVEPIHGEKYA